MRSLLLDSDVIVDFLRKGIDHSNIFKGIKDKDVQAFVTPITTFELYNWAFLSSNPKQKLEELSRLLEFTELIPLDRAQSYVASKIYTYLVKKGIPLEIRDILISSCAIAKNVKLFTKNKKHFSRIPELQLF